MNTNNNPGLNDGDSLSADERWVKEQLHQHIDAEVDNLDFNITSKLAAARYRVLSQENAARPRRKPSNKWLTPTAFASTAAVAALALLVGNQFIKTDAGPLVPGVQISSNDLMEDMHILSANDDIEFYQSMEFLEWMDENSR